MTPAARVAGPAPIRLLILIVLLVAIVIAAWYGYQWWTNNRNTTPGVPGSPNITPQPTLPTPHALPHHPLPPHRHHRPHRHHHPLAIRGVDSPHDRPPPPHPAAPDLAPRRLWPQRARQDDHHRYRSPRRRRAGRAHPRGRPGRVHLHRPQRCQRPRPPADELVGRFPPRHQPLRHPPPARLQRHVPPPRHRGEVGRLRRRPDLHLPPPRRREVVQRRPRHRGRLPLRLAPRPARRHQCPVPRPLLRDPRRHRLHPIPPRPGRPAQGHRRRLRRQRRLRARPSASSAARVGIKAPDDRTIVVTLDRPVPYFLQLVAFSTFAPNHASVRGRRFPHRSRDWDVSSRPDLLAGPGPASSPTALTASCPMA